MVKKRRPRLRWWIPFVCEFESFSSQERNFIISMDQSTDSFHTIAIVAQVLCMRPWFRFIRHCHFALIIIVIMFYFSVTPCAHQIDFWFYGHSYTPSNGTLLLWWFRLCECTIKWKNLRFYFFAKWLRLLTNSELSFNGTVPVLPCNLSIWSCKWTWWNL